MNTGMQLTKAQPASSARSAYHSVARCGTDGQVGDKNIGCRAAERFGDIVDRVVRLIDDIRRYLPSPSRVGPRDTVTPVGATSAKRWVLLGVRKDRLGHVAADLAPRDVKCAGYLDVADMIAAELDVHQAGDGLVALGVAIVADTLDERGGAVADTDDADPNFFGSHSPAVPARQT